MSVLDGLKDDKGRISLEQLTKLMLEGENKNVLSYLRTLPKEECSETRKKLIQNLEKIQKTRLDASDTNSDSDSKGRSRKGSSSSKHRDRPKSSRTKKSPSEITGSLRRPLNIEGRKSRYRSTSKSAAEVDFLSGSGGSEKLPRKDKGEKESHTPREPKRPASLSGATSVGIQIHSDLLLGKYKMEEELGKGMFGVVNRAIDVATNRVVAIKQINVDQVDRSKLPSIMREAQLLSTLNDSRIVQIYQVHKTQKKIYFVLEYLDCGSVYRLIRKVGTLSIELLSVYTRQILEGLNYLHGKAVIHRDIKAGNLLLNSAGDVKLCDFGTAKPEDTNKNFTVVGTPYWMAPEIIEMEGGGIHSDVWSLGCTIIEMFTGFPPYFELSTMQALFNIVEEPHPPIPAKVSPELSHFLMKGTFVKETKLRPSAKDLLEHPWILKFSGKTRPTYKKLVELIESSPNARSSDSIGKKTGMRSALSPRPSARRGSRGVPPVGQPKQNAAPQRSLRQKVEMPTDVPSLTRLVKKVMLERDNLKRENIDLKRKLEAAQREISSLKTNMK